MYEAFTRQFECKRISVREQGHGKLISQLQDGDVLIHNAANIASTDLSISVKDNFSLTKDIADTLTKSGKKISFIFISSMSILGAGGIYKDPAELSPYAFSKYLAELYCLKCGLPVSCVRFSTLFYGDPSKDGLSKMTLDAVKKKEIQLINGGHDRRDFIPLDIAVQYLNKIAVSSNCLQVYNIASCNSISFAEAATMIRDIIPTVRISNRDLSISPHFVLSEFKKDHISDLGIINFSMKDHIYRYSQQFL